MAVWDKVLEIANNEVGYLEKATNAYLDDKTANVGRNNFTKYARDLYPSLQGQAWCDIFCDWVFVQAYGKDVAKQMIGNGFSAYTPTSAQYYKNMNRWYTKNPQPGDQIFFKNDVRICHTGIVERVTSDTVYTIEGNTSAGTAIIPNGGGVCKKSYALTNSRIAGYGRPRWELVEEAKTFPEGWQKAEDGIRWWYQFADGSFAKDNGQNNGWYLINNHWFMFDSSGYMLTGLVTKVKKENGDVETFYLCEDKNNNEGALMRTNERGALEVWEVNEDN